MLFQEREKFNERRCFSIITIGLWCLSITTGCILAWNITDDHSWALSTDGSTGINFNGLVNCHSGLCTNKSLVFDASICHQTRSYLWTTFSFFTAVVISSMIQMTYWAIVPRIKSATGREKFADTSTAWRIGMGILVLLSTTFIIKSLLVWNQCVSAAESFSQKTFHSTKNWVNLIFMGFLPILLTIVVGILSLGERFREKEREKSLLAEGEQQSSTVLFFSLL